MQAATLHCVSVEEVYVDSLSDKQKAIMEGLKMPKGKRSWIYEGSGPSNCELEWKEVWASIKLINKRAKEEGISEEEKKTLEQQVHDLEEGLKEKYLVYKSENRHINDGQLIELTTAKIGFTYKSNSTVYVEVNQYDLYEKLASLTNRFMEGLTKANDLAFNAKCNVPVTNQGLLMINEAYVELDLCTDRLQSLLNDGWRIISVQPQPDQRRPDYVLGRYNKNYKR